MPNANDILEISNALARARLFIDLSRIITMLATTIQSFKILRILRIAKERGEL